MPTCPLGATARQRSFAPLRLMKILSLPVHSPAAVFFSWYCSERPPSCREVTVSVPWHGEPGLESVPAVEPTFVRLIVIFILKLMLPLWTVPFHLPLTLLAAWAGVARARVARMASGRMRARVMPALIPSDPARQARKPSSSSISVRSTSSRAARGSSALAIRREASASAARSRCASVRTSARAI